MSHLIAPSLLSADFANLGRDIEMINNSQADWFHIDVMDGQFVPNISFGFPIMKSVKELATKPLDVHLMIVDPDRYFAEFAKYGADIITFHYEAVNHLHRSIYAVKELGCQSGVVLNPHTPVSHLENVITDLDLVLLMSVNPGYGGQKFIDNSFNKIKELKELILKKNSKAKIEVDGGVGKHNIKDLVEAGADILVAGNAVFGSENPIKTIEELKNF